MRSSSITIGVFSIAHTDSSRVGGIILMRETLLGIHAVARSQDVRVIVIAEPLMAAGFPPPAWGQVDGWISIYLTEGIAATARTGVPLVLINASIEGVRCPTVLPDNRGGVAAAIHHLIDHGHTRIAFLGNLNVADVFERYAGYTAALAECGIPLDPTLVIDVPDDLSATRRAIQELIAAGLSFTAIFTTNDINAQIALTELRKRGYQVPDQVAVVGFDDMEHAQYTDPPLTTIRQDFYENGRVAARLLLARISGEPVAPGITYVPTTLIIRRSCGCRTLWDAPIGALPAIAATADWQGPLARELVRVIRHPLPLDRSLAPAQIWPGIVSVCQALAAVAYGEEPPADAVLVQAWDEAAQIITDPEQMLRVIAVLERTAARLGAAAPDSAATARLDALLNHARLALLRAYTARQKAATTYAEQQTHMNYDVSKALLDLSAGEAQHLSWLEHTTEIWGCLGLWEPHAGDDRATLTIVGSYAQDARNAVPVGQRTTIATFPPADQLPATTQGGAVIVKLFPVRTPARDWGVLALCGPIEPHPNTPMLAMLLGSALERDALIASLAAQQETVRVAHEHQLITENSHDLLSMLDPAGRYRYASPSFQHRLGYDPATLIGAAIFDFIHPEDRAPVRDQWAQLTSQGATQATFRYRHADGTWRWIEVSGTMSARQDEPTVVIVGRDISERRRLEAQLLHAQKMESVGQLAGGVAHDFNNLLTAISGYTDLARATLRPDDAAYGDLEEIQKAVQRASSLTRQLLAFARKQFIAPRILNLNDLIVDVGKLLRRLIGEDIHLVTHTAPDLGLVTADPHQIEQLLVNLAVNARDAMPGGGALTIETANTTLDALDASAQVGMVAGPYVLMAVSDTGMGMDAEVKQHLFEPFFTTKGVGKGTGLGLATCYGIVRQHGGHIAITSEAGRGTTVRIVLPRSDDPPMARAVPDSATALPMAHGTETILLVEDEATVRALAARVLHACGYMVLATTDGVDALRTAQTYGAPIDLLLTDVVMPHMGGPALVAQLAGAYPGLKVLFMSGYTDNMFVHHGQLDPGINLLQKPFSAATLARKVREMLDIDTLHS